MKLISLNVWCGIKYEALIKFLELQLKDTDIFCFQEVRNGEYLNQEAGPEERTNLFKDLEGALPDFTGYFAEMVPGVGMATFIRNNIKVEKVEPVVMFTIDEIKHLKIPVGFRHYPRLMQSIYLQNNNLIVHNFHGIPGNSKQDTPERDIQTNRLLKIINSSIAPQIIVGDFNLDMNTEAISRLGQKMKNLVKEGGFKTTRNANYNNIEALPYADYAFVTENLKIDKFEVLPDEVSDHLALSLNFT
ncbi:MAG: endonuclease/exonuclease/phosphatase family protein [Patescibacteria group bacterium]